METVVGSLAIPGATLAQIMQDFGSVEGDCDGILFGRLQRQMSSRILDDETGPVILQEKITARVTGYYCSGRVQRFYDSTGRLDQLRLSHIVRERQGRGEDPPIGWYMGRRNSAVWPSMREVAVTSYLRSGVVTTTKVEAGDTTPVISPELQSLRIGGQCGAVDQRKPSQQTADTQLGSIVVVSPGMDASVVSPIRKSSDSSRPRQNRSVDAVTSASNAALPACFFVLFTELDSVNNAVRTQEYRAFQSFRNPSGLGFEPVSVKIVNAELSVREFYESFVPVASIPSYFNYEQNPETSGQERVGGSSTADASTSRRSRSENSPALQVKTGRSFSRVYQDASDSSPESFATGQESFDSFQTKIVGLGVSRVENLYQQMLARLENLSTDAYASSLALQQLSRLT